MVYAPLMATIITSECINCGACETECPNTAIYQAGAEWELDGQMHPPLSNDIFYIVRDKCTECVGFYDHEACAAVCPVDCCVPDTDVPETEAMLVERARKLHPERVFGGDVPSRFRKEGAAVAAPPAGASADAAAPVTAPPPTATPPVPAPEAVSPLAAVPPASAPKAVSPPAAAPPAPAPKVVPAPPAATPPAPEAASGQPAAPPPASIEPSPSVVAPALVATEMATAQPALGECEVPVGCDECQAEYTVTLQHLRPGVVFYCPQCRASFVPTRSEYLEIASAVEKFRARWQKAFASLQDKRRCELEEFEVRQRAELADFENRLRALTSKNRGRTSTGAARQRWLA